MALPEFRPDSPPASVNDRLAANLNESVGKPQSNYSAWLEGSDMPRKPQAAAGEEPATKAKGRYIAYALLIGLFAVGATMLGKPLVQILDTEAVASD